MNSFDKLIMDAMVNANSMLMARKKILGDKLKAGHSVSDEYHRARRFQERYASFVRDWQYWYYDDLPGHGDHGPRSEGHNQKGDETQLGLKDPVGQGDRRMPRKKRK